MKIKPVNDILVSLKKTVQDTVKLNGGLELYIDTHWQHQNHVTCEGVIEGLPKDNPYNGKVKVGDEVCFSYGVVANRTFADGSDNFYPSIESDYCQQFINGHQEKINILAVQGILTKKWVAVFIDKKGNFQHGIEGSESEIERWKAQFSFNGVQAFEFKNLIEYQGKQYWKCSYEDLFAKKVKNKLVAVGDRVILKPIDVKVPQDVATEMGLVSPKSSLSFRKIGQGTVVSGGEQLGLKKGDRVSFDDKIKESYDYFGKKYYLVREMNIFGIWQAATSMTSIP